ncbi:MAG: DNA modification methylase [Thermomicrobiales bacterium]
MADSPPQPNNTAHISELTFDSKNARRHNPRNLGAIERSISTEGFGRSVLLANDGSIIAGNATIEAATAAGMEDVFIVESDGTRVIAIKRTDVEPGSERFHHLALADNRTAELATWDPDVLTVLADDGIDLSQFWFEDELADVLTALDEPAPIGLTDPDEVPEPPVDPITKPGDVWLLGDRHRVMCGDSTVVTDVDRLMAGRKADMVFTDPPYGMNYHGETFGKDGLRNDTESTFEGVLADSMSLVPLFAPNAVIAVCFAPARLDRFFVATQHLKFHRLLTIYKPNRMAKPWHGWIMTSEIIALFSVGTPTWVNENHCHDVYTFDYSERPDRSVDHPTVKPLSIVADVVGKGSKSGHVVLDPFLGSGTTLIACEQTGRTCYGMEISANYCDVVVKRWENHTGLTATLEAAR